MSAARTPGTLLAATDMPTPVPHTSSPLCEDRQTGVATHRLMRVHASYSSQQRESAYQSTSPRATFRPTFSA